MAQETGIIIHSSCYIKNYYPAEHREAHKCNFTKHLEQAQTASKFLGCLRAITFPSCATADDYHGFTVKQSIGLKILYG